MMEEKTYKTGDAQVPKNYRQIITVLLLVVLFLGCLVSALGFANIRLFRMLERQDDTLLSFRQPPANGPEVGQYFPNLGITGCYLTDVEQEYFTLPAGVYISEAAHPLLQPGDVLVSINDIPLTDDAAFSDVIGSHLKLRLDEGDENAVFL